MKTKFYYTDIFILYILLNKQKNFIYLLIILIYIHNIYYAKY